MRCAGPAIPTTVASPRIELTPKGRRMAEGLRAVGLRHLEAALSGWSEADGRTLAALIGRLVDDLVATPVPALEPSAGQAHSGVALVQQIQLLADEAHVVRVEPVVDRQRHDRSITRSQLGSPAAGARCSISAKPGWRRMLPVQTIRVSMPRVDEELLQPASG